MHLGKVECAYLRQGFITGLDEGTPVLMNLILFFLFRGGGFRCLKIKSENMFFGKTHQHIKRIASSFSVLLISKCLLYALAQLYTIAEDHLRLC